MQDVKGLLEDINTQYGTDLNIPDNILSGMITKDSVESIETFLSHEGLINNLDISLLDDFVADLQVKSFENSLKSFETSVNNNNLSQEEFERYNLIANSFKILNDEKPTFFDNLKTDAGIVGVAYLLWIIALIGAFVGCLGPQGLFFCVIAVIALVDATINTAEECAGYM